MWFLGEAAAWSQGREGDPCLLWAKTQGSPQGSRRGVKDQRTWRPGERLTRGGISPQAPCTAARQPSWDSIQRPLLRKIHHYTPKLGEVLLEPTAQEWISVIFLFYSFDLQLTVTALLPRRNAAIFILNTPRWHWKLKFPLLVRHSLIQ